uniref:Uncharacterized protein n=1 Tax=Oryza barthii TaxID=65489 RepID=A0A0D3GIY9_9ORYZ
MAEQEKMIQHLFDTGFTVPVDLTLDEAAPTYLFCCSRPLIFAFYTDMKMISVVRIAEKESLTEGGDLIFLVEKNRNVPKLQRPCDNLLVAGVGGARGLAAGDTGSLTDAAAAAFISGNPIQVVSSSLSQVTTLNHQPLFDQFAGYLRGISNL